MELKRDSNSFVEEIPAKRIKKEVEEGNNSEGVHMDFETNSIIKPELDLEADSEMNSKSSSRSPSPQHSDLDAPTKPDQESQRRRSPGFCIFDSAKLRDEARSHPSKNAQSATSGSWSEMFPPGAPKDTPGPSGSLDPNKPGTSADQPYWLSTNAELLRLLMDESEGVEEEESLSEAEDPPVDSEEGEDSDEENGEDYQLPLKWVEQRPPIAKRAPFSRRTSGDTDGITQPIDFFFKFFTESIIDHLIVETNRYAECLKQKVDKPRSLMNRWRPLDRETFLHFIGLLLHMATISLPRLSDYWNSDAVLFNLPAFKRVMSRDRFMAILKALHAARKPEPHEPYPTDKLYKIRPLIKLFHETVETVVSPGKDLCIDESILLWKGKLLRQQKAPNSDGLKLHTLTEPSGIVLRFIAGSGNAEVGGRYHVDEIVHKLMEGYLDMGHAVFMDNYYNSVDLVHRLLERRTYVTGMVTANRKGIPSDVTEAKLRRGEVVERYSDKGVCVMKWRSRKEVLMVSSEYAATIVSTTSKHGREKNIPACAVQYYKHMGGIDRSDQMMAHYPMVRESLKWTKKLTIHIIYLCLMNAYFLYKCRFPKMTLYDFRNCVTRHLLPSIPHPSTSTDFLRLQGHFPTKKFGGKDAKRSVRRRCKFCYALGTRRETSYFCPVCPNSPALCLTPCFQTYHSQ